jgi:CRP-like cAMP-binding protein
MPDVASRNQLISRLNIEDRKKILPDLEELAFQQGTVLHEPGSEIDYVYFPDSGMVSLLTVMANGRGIETATVGNEGVIGMNAGVDGGIAITRAVVQLSVQARRMPVRRYMKHFNECESLRAGVLRAYQALVGQIQQTAACNALHNADARLARWILQCQDCVPGKTLHLTQEFLSEMLAVRRTTVTEVATVLQNEKLIAYQRGRIEILNRDSLAKRACECYEVLSQRRRRSFEK